MIERRRSILNVVSEGADAKGEGNHALGSAAAPTSLN